MYIGIHTIGGAGHTNVTDEWNQLTNLTPHLSINIQHPHVFENISRSTDSTSHQQQWVVMLSGWSNAAGNMVEPCRWTGTSTSLQFAPVLWEIHTWKLMIANEANTYVVFSQSLGYIIFIVCLDKQLLFHISHVYEFSGKKRWSKRKFKFVTIPRVLLQ